MHCRKRTLAYVFLVATILILVVGLLGLAQESREFVYGVGLVGVLMAALLFILDWRAERKKRHAGSLQNYPE